MAELDGEIPDEQKITQLDSIIISPHPTDTLTTTSKQ